MQKHQFSKIFLLIAVFWTLMIGSFILFLTYNKDKEVKQLALLEAKTSINKDFAYRSWIASKGGIYVPITKDSTPNPYLHVPNRDVNTTNGMQLTLFNPAYSLRQMTEHYSRLYGIKSHITSLKLINPNNKPLAWEINALKTIEHSRADFYEITPLKELRYMRPFYVEQACLKCHGYQGYHIGDIRGGLSIVLPLERYYAIFVSSTISNNTILLLLWIIGLVGLYWGYRISNEKVDEKLSLYEQNLFSLVSLIEQRDNYTAGHGRRVGEYSRLIAAKMGLDYTQQEEIYRAGMLHDVGKIAIPDSILLKPGKLEPIEKQLIEEHVNASYDLLSKVDIFSSIAEIVRHHHERLDGSGYPNRLRGEEIPFMSQILAVADCFDAMTTNRIYKGRKNLTQANDELSSLRNILFRGDIIDAALEIFSSIKLEEIPSQRPNTPLEMERFSYFYKDPLTNVYSTGYLNFLFFEPEFKEYQILYFINLHQMNRLNKEQGWGAGDELLKRYAQYLQELFPESPILRYEGDDFIIFSRDSEITDLKEMVHPEWIDDYSITVSLQVLMHERFNTHDIDSLHEILKQVSLE
ncbi:MAG: DUF3365 domain-containing protein [Sulfuricurvum sp.]|nr:DUF3365 domain-containing protein [Sulfuricurvum sp.]MDD5386508.1 DUF3365 domain-containing protein [Sulfuricurvum sp.]